METGRKLSWTGRGRVSRNRNGNKGGHEEYEGGKQEDNYGDGDTWDENKDEGDDN